MPIGASDRTAAERTADLDAARQGPARRSSLRRGLDGLYDSGAVLAALCMVALLGVIVAQMIPRWMGHVIRRGADYAGYLMAAASFLAFAHTLNRGAHILLRLIRPWA